MSRKLYLIFIILLAPLAIFVIGMLTDFWFADTIADIIFYATFFISAPGLIILGIYILIKYKGIYKIFGSICILIPLGFLAVTAWALATGP